MLRRLSFYCCCALMMAVAACSVTPKFSPPVATAVCHETIPPPDAGEVVEEGAKLQVHPRARNMAADYSGCQSVWLDVGAGPKLIGRFWYERGRYIAYSAPLVGQPEATICRYRDGRLIEGDAHDCESDEARPIVSMAPGCFAIVRHSGLVNQPVPLRCQVHE